MDRPVVLGLSAVPPRSSGDRRRTEEVRREDDRARADKRPKLEDDRPPSPKRRKTLANRGGVRMYGDRPRPSAPRNVNRARPKPLLNNSRSSTPVRDVSPSPPPRKTDERDELPSEAGVKTGEGALSLLQQWAVRGFFTPKGSSLQYLSAYDDLWKVWKQRPEFPSDLSMGLLRGEVVRAGLWIQLADTTAEISRASTDIYGEELVAYQTTLAGLRQYRFNTRIAETALGHLMSRQLAECRQLRPKTESTTSNGADLDKLERDLEILRGQLSDLQIEIEQKEQEVEECQAAHAAAEELHRLKGEIDMLEEAMSHLN